MLIRLTIQNYVLIKHLEMEPSSNLTIITGETGAGKSIMLGAVGLLLGNRADTKVLFSQETKCVIEGIFSIHQYGLEELFEELDIDYDPQTIIRREISVAGKSRAFVNDMPVRLESLRQIGERLLNVHSQHETFDLGEMKYQLKMLDSFAQNSDLVVSYQRAYQKYKTASLQLNELKEKADGLRKDLDYFSFLFKELDELSLQETEQVSLEEELSILEHTEEIKTQLNQVSQGMSDSEQGVLVILGIVEDALKRIAPFSHKLEDLYQRLSANRIDLNDLLQEIEKENEQTEFNPRRAEEVNLRLNAIYRLQQKHKVNSVAELLEIHKNLGQKLFSVENLDNDIFNAQKEMEESLASVQKEAEKLSQSRKSAAPALGDEVMRILHELSIPDANFKIGFESAAPAPTGMDKITFTFSANKGIPAESIKKVASGGEFSRLMFAFKYIMAGKTSLPTIIFDEIDTGVSGEIALRLGQLMKEMGSRHQILTITHLPQIAAKGNAHYFVYKESGESTTASRIRVLNGQDRIDEIAKMIAGDNPSDSARESARELVNQ